jgi:hypothetical protein
LPSARIFLSKPELATDLPVEADFVNYVLRIVTQNEAANEQALQFVHIDSLLKNYTIRLLAWRYSCL